MEASPTHLNNLSVYESYQEIAAHSREIGRVHIRKSLYINTLNNRLVKYGGLGVWIAIFIASFIILILSGYLPPIFSDLTRTLSGTFICIFICIFGSGGIYADINIHLHGRINEDTIYLQAAQKAVNKFTVGLLLPVLILFAVLSSLFWPELARLFLAGFGDITLLGGILSGIMWTVKNVDDYYRMISAILGKKSVMLRNTDELVRDILIKLMRSGQTPDGLSRMVRLAENDLRRAEVRLELVNISIAGLAILFTILFSDQLKVAFIALFDFLAYLVQLFSTTAGNLIALLSELQGITMNIISIAIWIYLANLVLGLLFLIIRALLSVYFSNYRPAQALYQALLIIDENSQDSQGKNSEPGGKFSLG